MRTRHAPKGADIRWKRIGRADASFVVSWAGKRATQLSAAKCAGGGRRWR